MQMVLSTKEEKLLTIIRDRYNMFGEYPSYGFLMEAMKYKSKNSISLLVQSLIDKKHLSRDRKGGYFISKSVNSGESTIDVPLVGEVSCGMPILAEENLDAFFSISTKFISPGSKYFLLRAFGDSMNTPKDEREPIIEGDLLLVKIQNDAEDKDWVIALVDDSATVKEFYKKRDHVLLVPRSNNPKNKTMILNTEFKIQGVVQKVFKDLYL